MVSFTFIIPRRETELVDKVISAVKESCEELNITYEIFSVCGNNPTKQRNECIKLAKNEYIYFLDNDSIVTKESLEKLRDYLRKNPDTAIIGGPSISFQSDSYLQKNFNAILSSYLAVGKISSRYSRHGSVRETDDSELILCNLVVKKSMFKKYGGFNERLYPNEENEFVCRVKNAGEKVIYNPDIYVYRPQRKSLGGFIKQMFTYGRGRAEQIKIDPHGFRWAILIPVVFTLYFFTIAVFFLLPFYVYLVVALVSFLYKSFKDRALYMCYPFVFFLTHVCYGLGLICGFLKRNFRADEKVFYHKIERV